MWTAIAAANAVSQVRDAPTTLHGIVALAATSESETLEFEETTGTRREATMTMCAFLNRRMSEHKRRKAQ